jgi:hypothetical protein
MDPARKLSNFVPRSFAGFSLEKLAKEWGTVVFAYGSGAEQEQLQIPFGFAQGRLSTSLRSAQDDSSVVMQSFRAGSMAACEIYRGATCFSVPGCI